MPELSPDDLKPGNLQGKYAYAYTIGLLSEDPVQEFVDRVRRREGIAAPENAEDLAYNLEHHAPEELEPEAFEFLLTHIEEPTSADMGKIDPTQTDLAEYMKENPVLYTPPGMLESFMQKAIPVGDIRSDAARVIARHIVVGYMEVPEPIFSVHPGWVVPTEHDGVPQVLMIAAPGCDLDELIRTFKETCREMFGTGQRERGPDKAVKTAWQRAMAKYLRRQGEDEGRVDHKVAELSFEVWPETKPGFDEVSPQYEAAIRAEGHRFRTNSAVYAAWIDSFLGPDDEPQT